MKYSEIQQCFDDGEDGWPSQTTDNERKILTVLEVLNGRGGFGDWWHNIDGETQDEIFEELKEEIAKYD